MTKTLSDSTTLLGELSALLRLTRAEAQIARVRISQSRREEVRSELADNAREADVRADRIQATIRRLGGVPDVFADAVGRVTALTKATLEQWQPFSEGLLGDLALENHLRDRAVFTRVLAEAQDEPTVAALMRQLERAHNETIEWITVRLAEVAQGGPAALSPTPAQAAVGTVTRIALLPSRQTAALINKAVNLVQRGRGKAEEAVATTRDAVAETASTAGEVIGAGRDAALARTEEIAPYAGVRAAAHEVRENLGTIEAGDLAVAGYEDLSGSAAAKAINGLDDADEVRVVLRFERAHKNRKGVVVAAERRMTKLAEESINA